jgi:nucleoside-diphosphate-sugar epimerase
MTMTTDTQAFHLIFGTGPAACWTARALRERGVTVRAVNRSGRRPALMPADVAIAATDLMDASQTVAAARGARVVYQAAGPAYSNWAGTFPTLQANIVDAARHTGAAYVSVENLYMLDADVTMTETSPVGPRSGKGALRQSMHEALMDHHRRGDLRVVTVRSSDYYGPGVTTSGMGQRMFGPLVRGKAASVMGRADLPHSVAFIEDVGRALATAGCSDDPQVWGRVWLAPHADPVTQAWMVDTAGRLLGRPCRLSVLGPWMLRLAGLFNADAKASIEMQYQWTAPFVVDARLSQQVLGLVPTPLEHGLRRTLDWYAAQAPSDLSA